MIFNSFLKKEKKLKKDEFLFNKKSKILGRQKCNEKFFNNIRQRYSNSY